MELPNRLTNLQLELLKVFSYDLNETQLKEIKSLLGKYSAQTATKEMDKLWEEENWTDATMEQWTKEHLRKKGQ